MKITPLPGKRLNPAMAASPPEYHWRCVKIDGNARQPEKQSLVCGALASSKPALSNYTKGDDFNPRMDR
jgi:hypothetical protein